MKASEANLHELLEGTKQFQIPQFQRRYCWEEHQWSVLWEDLISIYKGEFKGGYFIGAIVTQSIPGTANGISPFFVIDGQQRLTTITILLAAIRDLLNLENMASADEINRHLVNDSQKDNDYYKIFYPYGEMDWDIYKCIISKNRIVPGNENYLMTTSSRIYKAFYFFKNRLDSHSINLDKLKNIILSGLILINITSNDSDNPYLIFEGLNNKGLLLTQGDLIRSYILMNSSTLPQKDEIHEEWNLLEKNFIRRRSEKGIVSTTELLTQYFWAYLRKDSILVTENQIYKHMIRRFEQSPDKYQLMKELNQFSDYYMKLSLNKVEPEERIAKYFLHFRELDFRTCNIFLLNIYQLYDNSSISCEDFEEILHILESYFVRRFFTNIPTNILGKVFDNLYKETLQNSNRNSIVTALKITLKRHEYGRKFPEDKDFRTALINKKVYTGNDRRRVKFILESLENSIERNTKEKSFVPLRNLTIEHIMPQKLDKWRESLGENYYINSDKWLHTLGNLTLTADNPQLSNKVFIEKKKIYKESNLKMNKYFDNIDNWNADTINERANYLADLAIKIWPML